MNELLEQFLVETRELVQTATDDLLALEGAPSDAEAVNRTFRAFHTLKGSVGLFDYPPWFALLHAAEDGLSAARAGTLAMDAALVDLALETLDATARWADAVEAAGRLPATAEGEAASLAGRYRALLGGGGASAPTEVGGTPDWATRIAARSPGPRIPMTAVRYVPRADCYFSGDDPLGLARKVPGLTALSVEPAEPWPDGEVDVYACNLVLTLLSDAPRADVEAVFRLVGDQVTVVTVPGADASPTTGEPAAPTAQVLDPLVAAVLAEQARVLASPGEPGNAAGLSEACARAAANALRSAGRDAEADACQRAAGLGAHALDEALSAILSSQAATMPGADARDENATTARPDPQGNANVVRSLRVDAARVDELVALVGELVVARNALGHLAARAEAGEDAADFARAIRGSDADIGRLATALHQATVSLRLTPLSRVFRRFARPVREAARGLGKTVELDLGGEDTEADRSIVDGLFEPLLHVVRNAVDHGLEDPATRRRAGKPEAGRIRILAGQDGDGIVVSVSDDGRGLDPAFIRRRAVERGLRTPEAVASLDDDAVVDLIFTPGFSTAEGAGALSGRGVGMDAVRAAAARMGGRVAVESRVGGGTVVSLHLPRTVALARIMTVAAGGEVYGIAMDTVSEIVRRPRASIQPVAGGAATILRGQTVPVVPLSVLLKGPNPPGGDGAEHGGTGDALLLVVRAGGEAVAMEIDGIEDRLDAVVRPPAGLIGTVLGVAGTTVRGDGRVLLVLDPAALLGDDAATDAAEGKA